MGPDAAARGTSWAGESIDSVPCDCSECRPISTVADWGIACTAANRPVYWGLGDVGRDPRECSEDVLRVPHGQACDATTIALALSDRFPARFRPSTLQSASRNLASSWTQAGYLNG